MAAVKLQTTQLPQLQAWLETHLPHTFQIHGELKSHLRGLFPDLQFFVDKWPHPQAVVAVLDPDGQQLPCKAYLEHVVFGVYGLEEDAVKALLTDLKVVHWPSWKDATFSLVSDRIRPWVERAIEEMKNNSHIVPCFLLKATPQHLTPIPIPEGLKLVSSISTPEIHIINSTWKFASEGSDTHIGFLVQHFPAVFLTTETGSHVGHMISYSNGTMGYLYVNPEFRGKGYAKVIVSQLAKVYFDRGEDAYVNVEEENSLSLSLHQKLGFKVVAGARLLWVFCSPQRSE